MAINYVTQLDTDPDYGPSNAQQAEIMKAYKYLGKNFLEFNIFIQFNIFILTFKKSFFFRGEHRSSPAWTRGNLWKCTFYCNSCRIVEIWIWSSRRTYDQICPSKIFSWWILKIFSVTNILGTYEHELNIYQQYKPLALQSEAGVLMPWYQSYRKV